MAADHTPHSNVIWQIANLLRGPYRPPQYECVMLPMAVLRRFDCALANGALKRTRRAGDGARHLTLFDPVAACWLDQRLARSAP